MKGALEGTCIVNREASLVREQNASDASRETNDVRIMVDE